MIDLFYRRPDSVSSEQSWENEKSFGFGKGDLQRHLEPQLARIPERLSFDRVMAGETCSPCTVTDFMNYLRFAEASSDSLQFYLWFREYAKRFHDLNVSEQSLSPPYRPKCPFDDAVNHETVSPVREVFEMVERSRSSLSDPASLQHESMKDVFSEATAQPFRSEIFRITSLYFLRGSPLELKLPVSVREATLEAIGDTTHPSAFEPVVSFVEEHLRNYAHPNFIRHALSNANGARLSMATTSGIASIAIALFVTILLTLSTANRFTRLSMALFFLIGVFVVINSKRGLCVILLSLGALRNLDPWEVYAIERIGESGDSTAVVGDMELGLDRNQEVRIRIFVKEYDNRPVLSRIYEKRVQVKDGEIRRLQITMILQSLLAALLATCVFEAIFLALPSGNFF